jgi:putative nucleotidyltransferase with HDIG domain
MVTGATQRPRGGPEGSISRTARWYVLAVAVVAFLVVLRVLLGDLDWDLDIPLPWTLLVLALLFLVCDSKPTITSRQSAWSPSSSATLAAMVLIGPAGAVLVGATALLSVQRGLQFTQRLFNASMYAISAYAASEMYLALGGRVGTPIHGSFPRIIGPFAAAAAVHVVINYWLLWALLMLIRDPGERRRNASVELNMSVLLGSDLGYATLGLLIAALWGAGLREFAAILVLVPLFVARWATGQFAAQQAAYAATMAALCQAVETKDFYTRGHSDRVSRGAAMLARTVGMRPARVEAIRYAGMLHDVGKLGVPTKVLQKNGPLTEEELAAIQLHPMRGLEIVREIGFLDEALAGIMHHHERMDGRGYPLGLAGDEIPEFARVIAVADAFDAMTSNRSYRGARTLGDAVADLRRWSGTQFDPALVDAFIAALEREGWPRQVPAAPWDDADGIIPRDHDDPTAPLRAVESY